MTKTVPAVKARQQFGSLLNEVDLTGASIVIERDGKPKAVMVSVARFEAWEKRREQARGSLTAQAERNQALLGSEGVSIEALMDELVSASKDARKEAVKP